MNDNDNIIDLKKRFAQRGGPQPPQAEPTRLPPTLYRIRFKIKEPNAPALEKEIIGYLGVSPLFVAITDERERILFMLPHGDYEYVEAVEDAVNLEADYEYVIEPEEVEWAPEEDKPVA